MPLLCTCIALSCLWDSSSVQEGLPRSYWTVQLQPTRCRIEYLERDAIVFLDWRMPTTRYVTVCHYWGVAQHEISKKIIPKKTRNCAINSQWTRKKMSYFQKLLGIPENDLIAVMCMHTNLLPPFLLHVAGSIGFQTYFIVWRNFCLLLISAGIFAKMDFRSTI